MSDRMRSVSLQAAYRELTDAIKQVGTADPTQTAVAETRLSAAQSSLAGILGSNSQQLVFIMRISQPTLATEPTLPWRFIDVFGTMVLASAAYFILYLVWQNIRDHRRV
jgi:capsule polysaccharide export protein KpsE/RkpR